MPVSRRGGTMRLKHKFEPAESLLLVAEVSRGAAQRKPSPPRRPTRKRILTGQWRISRDDPNALTLDYARYRFNDDEFSAPMPVPEIQRRAVALGRPTVVTLRYDFDCRVPKPRDRQFYLVLEEPGTCELGVNGSRMPVSDGGPWHDVAFRRINISHLLKKGRNTVDVKRQFYVDAMTRQRLLDRGALGTVAETAKPEIELESVYLIGDFVVKFPHVPRPGARGSQWFTGRPYLEEEKPRTTGRRLLAGGYPFFAGRLTLSKTIELRATPSRQARLELPHFGAVTALVNVNGKEAGTAWKNPFTVPVGQYLRKGKNTVSVTLFTSLRNLLGPHHHIDGELYAVGPESFLGVKSWLDRPDAPSLTWRADYNFINFGFASPVVLRY
jgi:hypothetical protein